MCFGAEPAWEDLGFFLSFAPDFHSCLVQVTKSLCALLICLMKMNGKEPPDHSSCPEKYPAILDPLKAVAKQWS